MDGMKSKEINKFQHRIAAVFTEDLKRGNSMICYKNAKRALNCFYSF